MRRPTDLALDSDATTPSMISSIDERRLSIESASTVSEQVAESTPAPTSPPLQPSIRLLFSLVPTHDFFLLVLPALFTSVCAGGIAPFMTYAIGEVFDAFADFPTSDPTEAARQQLLRSVGISAIELVGLAFGALALSSITSSLWIWTGERNLKAIRMKVFAAVSRKDMVWFDTKMGQDDSIHAAEGEGPVGAGGLMAQFARETDDVRAASSLASGMIVQYLTTCITCLVLAFTRSWALTLVILSAVPVLMLIQTMSQIFATGHLGVERAKTATAATLVDRAVAAIATVKAFNAETYEQAQLGGVLDDMTAAANKVISVWGVTSCLGQFTMMAMFVQGFWFGSHLVRNGTISAGAVMSVFWACLIATSNLQMCIPQLILLAKGKFAMASLLGLIDSVATPIGDAASALALKPKMQRKPTELRRIVPSACFGDVRLEDVHFAYPSRPTMPVLQGLDLWLPANEMSFIVGGSGSGKSTIAQLLLRMYEPTSGLLSLDDQELKYLDKDWTRAHIAAVSQQCILFDMSVHDNVAIAIASSSSGRKPQDVTRAEVEMVCRAALMHDFVADLPEGYETKLGNGGANLSGGQKQRLAIARALLRNPTVLVLDEATSALDATSRLLVFEAIKAWRRTRTTIVITHDLSQIKSSDFVYVLKDGKVMEHGFRQDLEKFTGEFYEMLATQGTSGLPEKVEEQPEPVAVDAILEQQDAEKQEEMEVLKGSTKALKHQSTAHANFRPLTMSNWMFDVVADLTRPSAPQPAVLAASQAHRLSRFVPPEPSAEEAPAAVTKQIRRQTLCVDIPPLPSPTYTSTLSHRYSLQFTPSSPTLYSPNRSTTSFFPIVVDDDDFDFDKVAMEKSAAMSARKRADTLSSEKQPKRPRARWDEKTLAELQVIKVEETEEPEQKEPPTQQSLWSLVKDVYPTVPNKPLVAFGMLVCLASGAMTPIFSYLLSQLLFQVSIGAQNISTINTYGGIVLGIAAADGLCIGLKYAVMETAAMAWVTRIRKMCIARVLAQDKKWFDKSENSPARLVNILIKDGDDARSLIATVLSQTVVVSAMLGVGLIWALVRGWQLTLVGFAIAPVFAVTMAVQSHLVAACETRNKRAREEVAQGYYDTISNMRAIRAMGFESAFQSKFDTSVEQALSTGVRGAFVEGCTYGIASGLIYLAEALLFYVGAVLVAKGTYDYLQMVQVLNLVVFTVSIGSQLMAFTQRIAKATQATRDFNALLRLSTYTDEARGILRPEVEGAVHFHNVSFSYPERPDVPVIKNLELDIADGECVAIVGSSGSGKSTLAALLQRLYEPTSGRITLGPHELRSTDAHHLRDHVAVVSQNPNLFDASISQNISYGTSTLTAGDVERAARAANVHDFIQTLPKGYDTPVGENASLISGGQAQRLQIARALARPARILILDECTSALDAANQAAVMETLRHAMVGRTTIVVTHKLNMMRMCDRIVVVHDGAIAESGRYESLMEKRGVFAQLASGGEWNRD